MWVDVYSIVMLIKRAADRLKEYKIIYFSLRHKLHHLPALVWVDGRMES